MAGHSYRDPWVKKAKWLTQALIISGTLNVGLLSTFIYFAMSEGRNNLLSTTHNVILDPKEKVGVEELLKTYCHLSFQELLIRLSQHNRIEGGYTRRDLALGCLVTFHHFNLERALGGVSLQKRELQFMLGDHQKTLTVFPGLADFQYQAILTYAKTEKWPLTSEGLFQALSSKKPPYDTSLMEAFYLTPEFHFLSMLFSKTGIQLKKEHLTALLAQASWPLICETAEHLQLNSDFSLEERRRFLIQMVEEKSKLAGKILLETDQEWCLSSLKDSQILALCQILGDKAPSSFLKELLAHPRTEQIGKQAAAALYEYAAEEVPQEVNLQEAQSRFLHLKSPKVRVAQEPKEKSYFVTSGDSLWKIARDHKTTVKELRSLNHLTSDRLNIGQKLLIPDPSRP